MTRTLRELVAAARIARCVDLFWRARGTPQPSVKLTPSRSQLSATSSKMESLVRAECWNDIHGIAARARVEAPDLGVARAASEESPSSRRDIDLRDAFQAATACTVWSDVSRKVSEA